MIIVRSPLRVSFFGGGTDHPTWFNRPERGAVLSTTIDKYVYVQLRRLPAVFDFNYRVAWGMLEEVQSIDDIQHPVVRAVLTHYAASEDTGYEVIYNADLPSKSGLGSSSAFTVSLLHAYFGNQERLCSKPMLAREAIFVEQKLLKETVGCQDQIAAAYGGFNRIDFEPGGDYRVRPVQVTAARRHELEDGHVDTGGKYRQHLQLERGVADISDGVGRKHQRPGDDGHHEGHPGKGDQFVVNPRERPLGIRVTQHPQIDNENGPEHQCRAQHMDGLDDGHGLERAAHPFGDSRFVHGLRKAVQVHEPQTSRS